MCDSTPNSMAIKMKLQGQLAKLEGGPRAGGNAPMSIPQLLKWLGCEYRGCPCLKEKYSKVFRASS
jgi:hypothetical protein